MNEYRAYQGGYFKTLLQPSGAGSKLAMIEFTLPKGSEPPKHVHTLEDEAFYVLEGELGVEIGESYQVLKAGEALFAPRLVPHSFRILTDQAKFINIIAPGDLWNYFIEVSKPIPNQLKEVAAIRPSVETINAQLERISTTYQVKFLLTNP
ncbi:Cupin 2 conserved barrel domain protein [Leadbetterella byssophila DSM 17132]|uniref:Cupin 2 conserved barrel domain protein n=1 Tax=Leadbetterella byssophila (strain DSM 17132 / JCM 16389 / KACC 11308 / NBRC 106382 / 4M15) TaxID=649349 RepID=E4RUS6_LEAB4|nr:cupin domain-containing protein [Leadbetterella byssophila]ADQ16077.1 Cupin 2 conserved barrel domain protein [Leadbetterella byssophila DSM 17132]